MAVALLGCGDQDDAGRTNSNDPAASAVAVDTTTEKKQSRRGNQRARGRSKPSITIRTPIDGQTVPGDAVTVSVSVRAFKVVEQRARPPFPRPVAGKGHVHFYLDTKTLPRTHSPPATGSYRSVSTTSYTWTGVTPGRHTFAVQLVGKDHAPLRTPVKDRIRLTVG